MALEGETLQIVDLKIYVILRSYLTGVCGHIPTDSLSSDPALVGLYEAVGAHPAVQGWLRR